MAAAARPPGISDARVPCPLCGGLIHPVAGRCKHCKQDLTSFRAGRPQAAAPLPSLQAPATPGNAATTGHAAAVPVTIPAAEDGSQPILPPRPTGRSLAAERPPSAWRSWPMLVIVLAVLAIVTAVVILMWPQHDAAARGALPPPPAPERMDTNPLPPSGAGNSNGADPWGGHSQADPPPAPRATPDPLPQNPPSAPDPDPDSDPFSDPFAGGTGHAPSTDFMFTALGHACAKLKTCPDVDASMLATMCDAMSALPRRPPPAGCASAQRCLDAIDHLSCSQTLGTGFGNPLAVVNMFQDCAQAATSC